MVLSDQRHPGHPVRPQQRHVDHVLGPGHLLRQIGRRHVRFRESNRVGHVRRGEHAAALFEIGAHQELHRLELSARIRPDPGIDGLADIAPAGDVVNNDVLASHPARFDQLGHQRHHGVRAGQAILGRVGFPLRGAILIAIDLDRDSLAGAISRVPKLVGAIETPEQRVPCLPVVLPSGQILKQPGSHAVDYFLVGVGVIPPVPCHTVPTGGLGVAHPHHPARINPLARAERMVRPLAGLKGFDRSHLASLLRHRLPWQYQRDMRETGGLGRGEGPQKTPSMHETTPFGFFIGIPGCPQRDAARPHRCPKSGAPEAYCPYCSHTPPARKSHCPCGCPQFGNLLPIPVSMVCRRQVVESVVSGLW